MNDHSTGWRAVRPGLLLMCAVALAACDSGGGGDRATADPQEPDDRYATATGETEPLYPFQWALNHSDSVFNDLAPNFDGGLDLNVEPVHRAGIKGKGINVLVLDSGVDLDNEDLAPNADRTLSWNFVRQTNDPYPSEPDDHVDVPHGTAVAGMIAAAQNGKGVMGISPRVRLGGANLLAPGFSALRVAQAYGGAAWSSGADVFNASYGLDSLAQAYDDGDEPDADDFETPIIRGLKALRGGSGAIFVKAAGNAFAGRGECGPLPTYFSCFNPANDRNTLEPNIVTIAALNARGQASSYSSAGSVVWVTGMAGEYGAAGQYGEGVGPDGQDGPSIFTTDMSGCQSGYSYDRAETPFLRGETVRNGVADNATCDYGYMNGTSAATPTLAGVAALILEANPALSWRDVRDILRQSARQVDTDYTTRKPAGGDRPFGARMDLTTNQLLDEVGRAADITDQATVIPVDLGWQTNAAGYTYSNRYGFGVPDTQEAIRLAQHYRDDPTLGRTADVHIPSFDPLFYWYQGNRIADDDEIGHLPPLNQAFPYRRVVHAGTLSAPDGVVDAFQLRLSGRSVCLGALGVAVRSPAGTVSLLKLPNDHFKGEGISEFDNYGLGSYAFYGEPARGDWAVFMLASNADDTTHGPNQCPLNGASGNPANYEFFAEARIISQ